MPKRKAEALPDPAPPKPKRDLPPHLTRPIPARAYGGPLGDRQLRALRMVANGHKIVRVMARWSRRGAGRQLENRNPDLYSYELYRRIPKHKLLKHPRPDPHFKTCAKRWNNPTVLDELFERGFLIYDQVEGAKITEKGRKEIESHEKEETP